MGRNTKIDPRSAAGRRRAVLDILGEDPLSALDCPSSPDAGECAAEAAASEAYSAARAAARSAAPAMPDRCPGAQAFLAGGPTEADAWVSGAGRPASENRLLASLGVDLGPRLTAAQTRDLLSAMLMSTESALDAVASSPASPVAARIVAKRLLDDARVGDMSSLERVWDRVFGRPTDQAPGAAERSVGITLPDGSSLSLRQSLSPEAFRAVMARFTGGEGPSDG